MLNHLKFFLPNGLHLDEKRERWVEKKGGGGRERGKRERKGEGGREGQGERSGQSAKALYSMFCDGATAQYKTHFFTQVL